MLGYAKVISLHGLIVCYIPVIPSIVILGLHILRIMHSIQSLILPNTCIYNRFSSSSSQVMNPVRKNILINMGYMAMS